MIPGWYPADLDSTPLSGTQYFSGTLNLLVAVTDYLSTPPGVPVLNSRYIVKPAGLVAWVGHDNQIAQWNGAAWVYTTPVKGNAVYDTTNDVIRMFNGTAWEACAADFTNYGGRSVLVNLDVTGGTATVTLGSYNPTLTTTNRFVAEKVLSIVTAGAATAEDWPLFTVPTFKAIKVVLSAGTGYIRTQGKVAQVVN